MMKIDGERLFVSYLHAAGGIWIEREPDYTQQVFSFRLQRDGSYFHFHVAEALRRMKEAKSPFEDVVQVVGTLEADEVAFVAKHNGIEGEGLARLTPARLEEPGMLAQMPDGSSVLIDGNHRYVGRFLQGRKDMKFWLLHEVQWRLCLLDIPRDFAEQLLTGSE